MKEIKINGRVLKITVVEQAKNVAILETNDMGKLVLFFDCSPNNDEDTTWAVWEIRDAIELGSQALFDAAIRDGRWGERSKKKIATI